MVVLIKARAAIHSSVYKNEGVNMKAKVNGTEVEGTPEEIAKLLGIAIEDPAAIVSTSDSFDYIPEACKKCSNYGKGPCMCTIPYMTQTIKYYDYQVIC